MRKRSSDGRSKKRKGSIGTGVGLGDGARDGAREGILDETTDDTTLVPGDHVTQLADEFLRWRGMAR